jgi:ferrous iron transport protein B
VVEISALKNQGVMEAAKKAVEIAKANKQVKRVHTFDSQVEDVLNKIEAKLDGIVPEEQKRFFAIKLLEKDEKITSQLSKVPDVTDEINYIEKEMDDDTESIITSERYSYISSIIDACYTKKPTADGLTPSDRIDRIVTNRWLGLPIFALIMFCVYYISITTVGSWATDWANDGLFGDGFHLLYQGCSEYDEVAEDFGGAAEVVNGFISWAGDQGMDVEDLEAALDTESDDFDEAVAAEALDTFAAQFTAADEATYLVEDEETLATEEVTSNGEELAEAVEVYKSYGCAEPDPADFGIWVPGVPVLVENALDAVDCSDWLKGLILDGIVAGVGAVLGFLPQMIVLFFFLAFLESCGYMARVAFVLDRIFRKFGLSGKSFIPILIGTGCGIPGVMASRTIENEKDRRMTVITTTFIPCGAKTPFIAMIAGAVFGGAAWVATSAYFLGMAAIICSGVILKKTKLFAGDPAPFVMELPAYHMPTASAIVLSVWERASSFAKKAGTIILLATILVWFLSFFGFVDGTFTMLEEDQMNMSILATIGSALCWIFAPLGFGNWQATVAAITGLIAKENIVGTLGILYSGGDGTVYQNMAGTFTLASGYAFLAFNLLCAPCFAAMGAIRREMNSGKWFAIAIGYQCGFAYLVALVIYQIWNLVSGGSFGIFTIVAFALIVLFIYLLLRPANDNSNVKAVRAVDAK